MFAGCPLADAGGQGAEDLWERGSERLHVLHMDATSTDQLKEALKDVFRDSQPFVIRHEAKWHLPPLHRRILLLYSVISAFSWGGQGWVNERNEQLRKMTILGEILNYNII